ncbi:MAG TPA: AAA family ATPase [Candidatus Methanoperedenaceae archaeon]|nr:AAA family ATPase [Candidatus Methanoperedenaceae archaeon]
MKGIRIAVSGKGGVGKTTFAGTIARMLARDGFDVLAVDADPSMNLATALGIANPPAPLTDHSELIDERAGLQGGAFRLNPKVDDIVSRFGVTGPDGVKLLVMGTVAKGGSGCMCPASAFLRALLRHIILKENSIVVMDMEAGVEHLGRGTTRGIDIMLIVVEPGMRSVDTAGRIHRLAQDIGITKFGAVLNKSKEGAESVRQSLADLGIPLLGSIPYDDELQAADIEGTAPIDKKSPAIVAIAKIKDAVRESVGQCQN